MAKIFTYSFEDTTVTISHPAIGNYSAFGTGIGQVSVNYDSNVTAHSVAADLSVVVSKYAVKNGTIEFQVLQSSEFNAWLKRWANILEQGSADAFADTVITITNRSTGDNYVATGCSHQQKPSETFGPEAQTITWTIMAANITNN